MNHEASWIARENGRHAKTAVVGTETVTAIVDAMQDVTTWKINAPTDTLRAMRCSVAGGAETIKAAKAAATRSFAEAVELLNRSTLPVDAEFDGWRVRSLEKRDSKHPRGTHWFVQLERPECRTIGGYGSTPWAALDDALSFALGFIGNSD